MIVAAREGVKPERAEQRNQHQRIARIRIDMTLRIRERLRRLAFDRRGDDVDVASFTFGRFGGKIARPRGAGARFSAMTEDRIHAGASDWASAKSGSSRDGAVQRLFGSVPRRQQPIEAVAISRGGCFGCG